MGQNWRTVRIFISSTFRDMHAERDHLINHVFPQLRQWCTRRRLHLVDVDLRWGVTEQEERQGKVLEICLAEIQRSRPFFIGLLGERYGWTPSEYAVPDEPQYDWLRTLESGYSLTALEIHHGALRDPSTKTHAFFYFRAPSFINDLPRDQRADFLPESDAAAAKLGELKRRIRGTCRIFDNYPCTVGGIDADGTIRITGLEEFGRRVLADLQSGIAAEYAVDAAQPDALATERQYHEAFIENSTRRFVGRRSLLDRLHAWADRGGSPLLVVTGKSGCGKSALLAAFARECAEKTSETFLLAHFIGVSPGSTDIRQTLLRLCRELGQRFDIHEPLPADNDGLRRTFLRFLEHAATRGTVLLLLDGLNQLDEGDSSHAIAWLPYRLPAGVRVLASALEGDCLESLRRRVPAPDEVVIAALAHDERRDLVRQTLGDYRKALDERRENNQMELLLGKAESDQPLYLIVACEEMRVFGNFERVTDKIAAMADDVEGLFSQVLERMEVLHGETIVRSALTLIECSRYGLLENELLDLLARDGEVQLPQVIWSRLFWSLRPYLRPPGESEDGAIDFFHRQLSKAVRTRYLRSASDRAAFHRRLADLFQRKADPDARGAWDGHYPRGLSELAHHFLEGGQHDNLFRIARDEVFLGAQANAFPDEPAVPLDTLQKALAGAAHIDEPAHMAEFMLSHARHAMTITDDSPLDALRGGRLEQALKLADVIFARDREKGVLWFLLLAWQLERQDQDHDARRILSDLARRDWVGPYWQGLAAAVLRDLCEIDEPGFPALQQRLLTVAEQCQLCRHLLARVDGHLPMPASERTIHLALEIAARVEERSERSSALRDVALAHATAGRFESARESARLIAGDPAAAADVLAGIAGVQAAKGAPDGARSTFAAAAATALAIEDDSGATRSCALSRVAQAQALAGYADEALETTKEIGYPTWHVRALTGVAVRLATEGKVARADSVFQQARDRMQGMDEKIHGSGSTEAREIAQAQAAAGRYEAAVETARTIAAGSMRGEALCEIAEAQAGAGHLADAQRTSDEAVSVAMGVDGFWRVKALCRAARAQVAVGRPDGAITTLHEARQTAHGESSAYVRAASLLTIAEAHALSGRPVDAAQTCDDARKAARQISSLSDREELSGRIAKAQARAGNAEAAIETAQEVDAAKTAARSPQVPGWVLKQVAGEQVSAGRTADAMRTSRALQGGYRVEALREIARAQAADGNAVEAAGTLQEAVETARREGNRHHRSSALHDIATAQAAVGHRDDAALTFEEALTTATEVRSGSYAFDRVDHARQSALTRIATTQAAAGDVAAALATARTIDGESHLVAVWCEAGKAQVRAGEDTRAAEAFRHALDWARRVFNERVRVEAISMVARAQAAAGWAKEATETFEAALGVARACTTLDLTYGTSRIAALAAIAQAHVEGGDQASATRTFEEALDIARRDRGEEHRERGLSGIAQAQAAAGRIEAAVSTAREITWKTCRVAALRAIAQAQSEAGRVDEAAKSFTDALVAAAGCHDSYTTNVLMQMAKARARGSESEASTTTFADLLMRAQRTSDLHERERLLTDIACAQASVGSVADAIHTMQAVFDGIAGAIPAVASAFVVRKSKEPFKQLLTPASHHVTASYEMCGLLAQLYAEDRAAVDGIAAVVTFQHPAEPGRV